MGVEQTHKGPNRIQDAREKCSAPLHSRQVQIKTTVRCSYTLVRMTKRRKIDHTKSVGEDVEEMSSAYIADENAQQYNLLANQFGSVLKVNHTPITWYSHIILKYFPERNESVKSTQRLVQECLQMLVLIDADVYLRQPQIAKQPMSAKKWMEKQTVVYTEDRNKKTYVSYGCVQPHEGSSK